MTNLGLELVLHRVAFPNQSNEQDEFCRIKIVEIRQVPGVWKSDESHEGWDAVDVATQKRHFHCNWESFDDASMTPTWMWDEVRGGIWYDITQGMMLMPPPGEGVPLPIQQNSDLLGFSRA